MKKTKHVCFILLTFLINSPSFGCKELSSLFEIFQMTLHSEYRSWQKFITSENENTLGEETDQSDEIGKRSIPFYCHMIHGRASCRVNHHIISGCNPPMKSKR